MRIGLFTSIDGWGGSERYLELLAGALRSRGLAPVVLGLSGTELARRCAKHGIEFVSWRSAEEPIAAAAARPQVPQREPWLLGPRLILGCLKDARRLAGVLRASHLDVLHVNVHGYEMAGLAARLAGCPAVGVYHISPVPVALWARRWLARVTARSYACAVCVSEYVRSAWQRELRLAPARMRVVMNGIDTAPLLRIERRERDAEDAPLRLLCMGRLHPMKGHRFAVDALARARDPRLELTIAGEGAERGALEAQVVGADLGRSVRLLGHRDDSVALLAAADAFVMPSVSHEGCPLALMEAQAAGLPAVTSDFGPLPELNRHGVTGLVTPMGDSGALAQALRRLADNPMDARRWGVEARRQGRSYDLDRMAANTEAAYRDAVGDMRCRRAGKRRVSV
jgi:glycosyltransferase involved in cell wall biosynthesis